MCLSIMSNFRYFLIFHLLFYAGNIFAIEPVKFEVAGLEIGDELTNDFYQQYCLTQANRNKEIECKRKLKMSGVSVLALYLFYDSSLIAVSFSYDSHVYVDLVKAFSKKLSHFPSKKLYETVSLNTGAQYINEKNVWHTTSGDFILEKYGNNLTKGYAHINSQEYLNYLAEKKSEVVDGEIKRLLKKIFG